MRWLDGITESMDGRESEWTPGDGDGQGGLACCNSRVAESDMTERLNWTELNWTIWNNVVYLCYKSHFGECQHFPHDSECHPFHITNFQLFLVFFIFTLHFHTKILFFFFFNLLHVVGFFSKFLTKVLMILHSFP